MAILDEKREVCVVRIVYDGPPFSGKTTTLRALSEHLSRPMESPEEHGGRTLYFDWLDYTAGRFEGRPVRCQIVSVPGQRSLVARRQALLREADSVVFIADTGSIGMDLSLKYARELGGVLSGIEAPRPGVVIGANKRDVDDAVPIEDVVERFRSAGLDGAVIETTATAGTGIHEAFLFGVRLALDRAREQNRLGLLMSGTPAIDSCDDLLRQFTEADETKNSISPAPSVPLRARAEPESKSSHIADAIETSSNATKAVQEQNESTDNVEQSTTNSLPDPSVSSGLIWPPIEGRIIIQQALVSSKPIVKTSSTGDLYADAGGSWEIHSRKQDIFADQQSARLALVEWARLHVRNTDFLSTRRCIVVSPYEESWRLWQIVKTDRSIDSFLSDGIHDTTTRQSIEHLLVACRKILGAAKLFAKATVALPIDTGMINVDSVEPAYIGLMPGFDAEETSGEASVDLDENLIVTEALARHANSLSARTTSSEILLELDGIRSSSPTNRGVAALLQKLLIKEKESLL